MAATAALFTAGFSAISVAPASAAPEECGVDQLCVWGDGDFIGPYSVGNVNEFPSGECANLLDPAVNDTGSSAVNRSSRNIVLYADTDCQGESLVIPPNSQIGDFGAFNDKLSSVRL